MSRTDPEGIRPRILIVDDDPQILEAMAAALREDGHEVRTANSALSARANLEETRFDLIILDLMLPGGEGLLLCGEFSRLSVPFLVCSATIHQRDGTLTLRLGASDVVSKPFDLHEFKARVARILASTPRPKGKETSAPEKSYHLRMGRKRRGVRVGKGDLEITPTEFRLLFALAKAADRVATRSELAEAVWGYDDPSAGRAIDVHLGRLRSKLNSASANLSIFAVRDEGYTLLSYRPDLRHAA